MNFPTACTLSVLFSCDLPLVCSNSPLFVKLSYFHLSHSYEMFPFFFFLSYSNKSGFILIFRFLTPRLILLPLSHTAVTRLQDLYPFLPAPEVPRFIILASSSSGVWYVIFASEVYHSNVRTEISLRACVCMCVCLCVLSCTPDGNLLLRCWRHQITRFYFMCTRRRRSKGCCRNGETNIWIKIDQLDVSCLWHQVGLPLFDYQDEARSSKHKQNKCTDIRHILTSGFQVAYRISSK